MPGVARGIKNLIFKKSNFEEKKSNGFPQKNSAVWPAVADRSSTNLLWDPGKVLVGQSFENLPTNNFDLHTVKPLITNTSKEFIKCRILHFLIMECCSLRIFSFLIK